MPRMPSTTAVRLRLLSPGVWSEWKLLDLSNLPASNDQAIYILRAKEPLPRIRGESDVLYVGITKGHADGIQKRIKDHALSKIGTKLHRSSASRYIAPDLLSQIGIQIEFSWRKETSPAARNRDEADLLQACRTRHIELPPGNSAMPGGGYSGVTLANGDF